jgi:hypothetical protein
VLWRSLHVSELFEQRLHLRLFVRRLLQFGALLLERVWLQFPLLRVLLRGQRLRMRDQLGLLQRAGLQWRRLRCRELRGEPVHLRLFQRWLLRLCTLLREHRWIGVSVLPGLLWRHRLRMRHFVRLLQRSGLQLRILRNAGVHQQRLHGGVRSRWMLCVGSLLHELLQPTDEVQHHLRCRFGALSDDQ